MKLEKQEFDYEHTTNGMAIKIMTASETAYYKTWGAFKEPAESITQNEYEKISLNKYEEVNIDGTINT